MKTLKFSFLLVILIALVSSFIACDPINPPEPPEPPVTVADSVIVKVNFDILSNVDLGANIIYIRSSALKDGFVGKVSGGNERSTIFAFGGKEAKALIGATATFSASMEGRYNNHVAAITWTNPDVSLVLKKGLNEVTLHFTVE